MLARWPPGRVTLLVVAAGLLVLLVVLAAVIAGAAFAPSYQARESAARTLDLLLRLARYRPRPPDARGPAPGATHRRRAGTVRPSARRHGAVCGRTGRAGGRLPPSGHPARLSPPPCQLAPDPLCPDGAAFDEKEEPLEPPELYDYFMRVREEMGLEIVELGSGTWAGLLKFLREGRLVGLLCDRDIIGNGVEVEFFGETTTFPSGPAALALRSGAVLLPTVVYSGPGRDHSAVIRPPLDTSRTSSMRADVKRVTQDLAHELESFVRRAPEQWHLFQPNWPSDELAMKEIKKEIKKEKRQSRATGGGAGCPMI